MEREMALHLYGIYKIEKECGREVYPDELRTHNVCTASRIPTLLEELKDMGAIEETNNQGANVYHVTNTGITHGS